MADQAKGLPPSEAVRTPTFPQKLTTEVLYMFEHAVDAALTELEQLWGPSVTTLPPNQCALMQRLIYARSAGIALRHKSHRAIETLLKLQADADALEGQVNP
jgi:hypothetical protein